NPGQRRIRLRRHCFLPEVPAKAYSALLHFLPADFWHNSNRSGSLPPASGMKLLSPTQHKRVNEATGLALLSFGSFLWLSLLSYQALDPSANTSAGAGRPLNLIGYPGSYLADILLQTFG